jgi:hypothetical protein
LARVFACWIRAAVIVALHLGQRQRVDRRAWCSKPASVRAAHQIRVEEWIVRDDDNAILGDGHVGLDRADADLQRAPKGG